MSKSYDVCVVGGGMVGAAQAALLSRAGYDVALLEANRPAEFNPEDEVGLRVSAISAGSRAILEQAGAWKCIQKQRYCAYREMHVEEQGSNRGLDFLADEFGRDALGYIIENQLVQSCLWKSIEAAGEVDIYSPDSLSKLEQHAGGVSVTLASGKSLECKVLAASDGALSSVRKMVGIDQQVWEYNERGLVAVITTEEPNPGIAWQRFLSGGPLALLPLSDGRSSIVWTQSDTDARRRVGLPETEFLAELSDACRNVFGRVVAVSERASFPLRTRISEHFLDGRVVLLGDAAHAVHPLAGQGVNLGFLDAAALTESLLAADEHSLDRALRHYARWRRSDSVLMTRGFHAIHELFALPGQISSKIRQIGMRITNKSWFTKDRLLLHAAGQHSDAPRLAKGETLREIMRS
ncbi:MAG: FAD-dependent monooxygenase [Xanthomonadales bacterium]|nr:FAD-dependent monooxygenase [Xanthomonadales bacterium]